MSPTDGLYLKIGDTLYAVSWHGTYCRLQKPDGTAYDVTTQGCDCPHWTFRYDGSPGFDCKHRRLLSSVGLLPALAPLPFDIAG